MSDNEQAGAPQGGTLNPYTNAVDPDVTPVAGTLDNGKQVRTAAPAPRQTSTYAILPVNPATYAEISKKLKAAGYDHAFKSRTMGDPKECISMDGLALAPVEHGPNPVDELEYTMGRIGYPFDDAELSLMIRMKEHYDNFMTGNIRRGEQPELFDDNVISGAEGSGNG